MLPHFRLCLPPTQTSSNGTTSRAGMRTVSLDSQYTSPPRIWEILVKSKNKILFWVLVQCHPWAREVCGTLQGFCGKSCAQGTGPPQLYMLSQGRQTAETHSEGQPGHLDLVQGWESCFLSSVCPQVGPAMLGKDNLVAMLADSPTLTSATMAITRNPGAHEHWWDGIKGFRAEGVHSQ